MPNTARIFQIDQPTTPPHDPKTPGTTENVLALAYLELRLRNGTSIFVPIDDRCIPGD